MGISEEPKTTGPTKAAKDERRQVRSEDAWTEGKGEVRGHDTGAEPKVAPRNRRRKSFLTIDSTCYKGHEKLRRGDKVKMG